MEILCPGCHKHLRVPDGTIGRRARCQACRCKFVIADPDSQNQQTLAGHVLDQDDAGHATTANVQEQTR